MATFVLIHGGWDGGWCWREVEPYLRGAGHDVLRPSLTGLGDRVHLRHPGVTMETHIEDVANVLTYEGVRDAVLVGWSYGGGPITGAAERVPERVKHLVYLDAFVPEHGRSVADLLGPEVMAGFERTAAEEGDGWRLPYNAPNKDDGRPRVDALLNPWKDAFTLADEAAARIPRTFILCTASAHLPLFAPMRRAAERAKQGDPWRYRELPTGHTALWSMPRETADLLLEAANAP